MTSRLDYLERTFRYSYALARLRDLVVLLDRGNREQAESTLAEVSEHLRTILATPGNGDIEPAQQTYFAVDEARTLLSQNDFDAAAAAARDAAREWKKQSGQRNATETA